MVSSVPTTPLHLLFQPKSIAIIGASDKPYRIGYQVIRSLLLGNYPGEIYPINPRLQRLLDLPAFSSVEAVSAEIDLAIIVLRKDRVLEAIDECARKAIHSVIVMSSGFGELGDIKAENELVNRVHKKGMRMLGPNCAGFAASWEHIYASFENRLQKGHLAFISQSGAMCAVVLAMARTVNLGLSMFISYGNAGDIGPDEILEYLGTHEPTHLIGCYLEGIKDARKFLVAAQRIIPHKPIVVLKPGNTVAAVRAIQSHTGTLAGEQALYSGAFRQAGVLQTNTLEEFIDACQVLSTQPLPQGNRVAVVTNSGGPGVLAVDACARQNLHVIPFSQKLVKEFEALVPPFCPMKNPIDVGPEGNAEMYRNVVETLLSTPQIDMVLVLCVPTAFSDIRQISQSIAKAKKINDEKPLVTCWLAGDIVDDGIPFLTKANIPNYPIPNRAATALGFLHQRAEWLLQHVSR